MSENEQQTEQTEEQAEAEFASGFEGTETPPQKAEGQKPQEPAQTEQQPVAQEQTSAGETPAEDPLAGLNPAQVRELLAKASQFDSFKEEFTKTRDTLFGKLGEVNRTISNLQGQSGGKLTPEAFKSISERLGPEVAEAMAKDLAGVVPSGQPIDLDEKIKPHLEKVRAEMQLEFERRSLLRQHKDFYEQANTPEFQLWLNQQDEDTRKQWPESIDSDWLGEKMTDFKSWRDGLAKKQEKQKRLEQAIAPVGTQAVQAGMSDEDAFLAGFKS